MDGQTIKQLVAIFLTVPYWKSRYFTKPSVKKGGKNDA